MYECPNCNANLKYNISKQALFCEHCDTTMDPYSFQKESDAEESTSFGVTIFTCPQCGGTHTDSQTSYKMVKNNLLLFEFCNIL